MKMIYYNIFGLGHINPSLSMVKALHDVGAEIIYHTSPERKALVESTGATFRNYGYDSYSANDFNPGKNFVLQNIPAAVGLLPFLREEFERERPDFIFYDSMAPWGYILSKIYNVPAYCIVSTFAINRKMRKTTMEGFGIQMDEKNQECLDYLKTEFGIEMKLEDALGCYGDDNILFTTQDLNPPLEDMADKKFHFMGAMVDRKEDLTGFPDIDPNKNIITMSLGTILPTEDPSVINWYRELVLAFGNDERFQLIMNAPDLGPLPSNCYTATRIPQLHALKHSDVFIHHAGMNSLNEGIHFNVPMLAIPHSKDQFINARQLVATGKGLSIDKNQVSASLLKENVLKLLGEHP